MTEPASGATPPYVSYKTFKGLFDHFAEVGVPSKFDRTFWGTKYNGATGATLRGSLAFFNLIDGNDKLSPRIDELATTDEAAFKAALAGLLKNSYKALFNGGIDLQRATTGELRTAFEDVFGTKSTTDKAVSFFLHAAKDTDIAVSPFFRTRQKRRPRSATRVKQKQTRTDETPVTHAASSETRLDLGPAAASGLILEAFRRLPKPGGSFPAEDRKKWLALIQSAFEMDYESE